MLSEYNYYILLLLIIIITITASTSLKFQFETVDVHIAMNLDWAVNEAPSLAIQGEYFFMNVQ